MWEDVKQRYSELKSLDTNCVIDFADRHKYQFPPVATVAEILAFEEKIGAALPEQLKCFYLEMGNGGPGPDCYMHSLGETVDFRANQEWKGCDYYGNCDEDFEDCVCGLLDIMGAGYAHENGIVMNGDEKGKIIAFNSVGGWIFVQNNSLLEFYHDGFDGLFDSVNKIRELIEEKLKTEEILRELDRSFRTSPENGLVKIATLTGFPFEYNPDGLEAFLDKSEFKVKDTIRELFDKKIEEYRHTGKSKQFSKIYKTEKSEKKK
jgi:hypothetical protein